MRRSGLIAVGSLLAALAVPAGSPAGAAAIPRIPKPVTYEITLSASLETTYSMPKQFHYRNCYDHFWHEASAKESWTFKSRRPVRAVVRPLTGDLFFFDAIIPAGGRIVRESFRASGAEPGPCGGGDRPEVYKGSDCGTKLVGYGVGLSIDRGRLGMLPLAEKDAPPDQGVFNDCYVQTAKGVGGGWPDRPTAPISLRALKAGRAITAKVSKTWTGADPTVTGTKESTTTKLEWTVTFKPVKRR